MRLVLEKSLSLPFQLFSNLGMGRERPAEIGPTPSWPSARNALLLFFAFAMFLVISVIVVGSWRSANSTGRVQFPPVEWSTQPPQWID